MAARENQGLQIAVMVCFLLVVLLAVMTIVLWKSSGEKSNQIASMQKDLSSQNTATRSMQEELNEFKRIMGFAPEDGKDLVLAEFKKDIDTFAVGFDEGEKTYRKLVQKLYRVNGDISQREAASKRREQDLKSRIDALEGNKDKQIVQYKQSADKAVSDLATERNEFNANLEREKASAAKIAEDIEAKREDVAKLVTDSEEQVQRLNNQVNKLSQLNKEKDERLEGYKGKTPETPDGRVTWVNQRTQVVWINLGQGDALKRQTTFSVYPSEENKAAVGKKKGSIEVTRIIDEHMAEAKILEDDYGDPIVPGDKIHSVVWKNGRRDAFALVGFMDIDGDGKSDRDRIRDLIALNGGEIDCEMLDDGEVVGELKLHTRYLIVGETPEDTSDKSQKILNSYSDLTEQAQELGVETIALNKFIDQIGWRPDQRTVGLGPHARSEDFRAKPPEGGQRMSTGVTSGEFQRRKRPRTTF